MPSDEIANLCAQSADMSAEAIARQLTKAAHGRRTVSDDVTVVVARLRGGAICATRRGMVARGLVAVARLTFTLDGSERIVERAITVYASD